MLILIMIKVVINLSSDIGVPISVTINKAGVDIIASFDAPV